MVGEGEGRVKQEIRCLVVHVDVYHCGVDDDVGIATICIKMICRRVTDVAP